MNEGCFIPKKIKVGYQNRNDTYSGKLAYVIYYDEKGNLRKEPSWQNWRDKTIESNEFNNELIEGFVLNKKTGDYTDWFHRQAYIRVFDPRGFEIEITVNNLLYILENCDSIKGKGLIGRFCYGWIGKDLVLLPEQSKSYQESAKYTEQVYGVKKIKKDELVIGKTYILKGNKKVIYLGYKPFFSNYCYNVFDVDGNYCGMKHYYVSIEELSKDWSDNGYHYFYSENNFNPIAVSDEEYDYSQIMNEINKKSSPTGKFICFYNEKEIQEILKKCEKGFYCYSIREKQEYFYGKKSNSIAIYHHKTIWKTEEIEVKPKEIVRYHDIYYIGNFINGNLVSKEERIRLV